LLPWLAGASEISLMSIFKLWLSKQDRSELQMKIFKLCGKHFEAIFTEQVGDGHAFLLLLEIVVTWFGQKLHNRLMHVQH